MTITTKQEKFAQSLADGMTQADAYRTAYSADRQTDATVWANASRMAANSMVVARVASLKALLADKALWTREKSVAILAKIADNEESKAVEQISAIKELNIMHGFNAPTQIELGGTVITRIERHIVNSKD